MRGKLLTALLTVMIGVCCATYASGSLMIANVEVTPQGKTLSTRCVNTTGYYFEIGRPKEASRLIVYGQEMKMPLKSVVRNVLVKGWHIDFGSTVDQQQQISWRSHQSWEDWLKQLSFRYNLAVIVDWKNRTVYINRL